MTKLPKPKQKPGDVFSACIARVREKELKTNLDALLKDVEKAAKDYDSKGKAGRLFRVSQTSTVGRVNKKELQKVYRDRMAKPEAPGRSIYDELMVVPQKRCPLCAQRDVSTLDHYLPETAYSLLVVVPVNLVPSCKDCNFKKRAHSAKSAEDQLFHPYYDEFGDEKWLKATLIDSDPVAVDFLIDCPDGWSSTESDRAKLHFSMLELGELYASHAAGELVEYKKRLRDLFEAGGSKAVKADLESTAVSVGAVRRNSWREALYLAASETDWFCEEGFERIAE
jgi:hypothetical protein